MVELYVRTNLAWVRRLENPDAGTWGPVGGLVAISLLDHVCMLGKPPRAVGHSRPPGCCCSWCCCRGWVPECVDVLQGGAGGGGRGRRPPAQGCGTLETWWQGQVRSTPPSATATPFVWLQPHSSCVLVTSAALHVPSESHKGLLPLLDRYKLLHLHLCVLLLSWPSTTLYGMTPR